MKTRGFITVICSTLLLAIFLGYAVFWFVLAAQIDNEIENFYISAAQSGIAIEGTPLQVTGFPGKHQLHFSGTLHQDNLTLRIPSMEISGFPLFGQMILIDLPQGLSISEPSVDEDLWSLNYLNMSVLIPSALPAAATVESLRKWRDDGGNLEINSFSVHKGSLQLTGYGQLKFDSNLQVAGYANVVVRGHAAFLGYLEEKKLIDPRQKLITSSVFNGLSSQDKASGERFLKASLSIQNGKLLLGPIQIMTLPVIEWPYENMPTVDIE